MPTDVLVVMAAPAIPREATNPAANSVTTTANEAHTWRARKEKGRWGGGEYKKKEKNNMKNIMYMNTHTKKMTKANIFGLYFTILRQARGKKKGGGGGGWGAKNFGQK